MAVEDDLHGTCCSLEFGLLTGVWLDGREADEWSAEIEGRRRSEVDAYTSDSVLLAIARICTIDVNEKCTLFGTGSSE